MGNAEFSEPPTREQVFLSELPLIERVIAFVCRRHHLCPTDAEDFASHAKMKLMDNQFAVLGKFQGRSSLKTFLTVTVHRLFLDYRIASWGKWRPSAEARRGGPTAILLEQLVHRDGYRLDEAFEVMSTNHRLSISRDDFERLAARLPARVRRRFEGEEALVHLPGSGSPADLLEDHQRTETADRVTAALRAQLAQLATQDRLILTLRFADGRSVSEIAAALTLEQKPLYRRLERLLGDLRTRLEAEGISAEEVAVLFEPRSTDLLSIRPSPENPGLHPSIAAGGDEWR